MRYLRSSLVVAVCFCLASAAIAQTNSNVRCLNLGDLAGKPAKVLWANSFSTFLDAHRGELSTNQTKLVQQAIDFGSSRSFALNNALSLHTIKGLLASAHQLLTNDQFSEILAGMGSDTQQSLFEAGAITDFACACTVGPGDGCPSGYPCAVGCHTWGTGAWNGLCTGTAQQTQSGQPEQQ
ncbi:MAG: hypothetical protein WAM82_19515 [Thermoanaerobaculia bacterium]